MVKHSKKLKKNTLSFPSYDYTKKRDLKQKKDSKFPSSFFC